VRERGREREREVKVFIVYLSCSHTLYSLQMFPIFLRSSFHLLVSSSIVSQSDDLRVMGSWGHGVSSPFPPQQEHLATFTFDLFSRGEHVVVLLTELQLKVQQQQQQPPLS